MAYKAQPDKFVGFELRVSIVLKVEEYNNREDAHGGPGFYLTERVLTTKSKAIPDSQISQYIDIKETSWQR